MKILQKLLGLGLVSGMLGPAVSLCAAQAAAPRFIPTTIRRVAVLGGGKTPEVEVTATGPVRPEMRVLTGPDRLVLDFPGCLPGLGLRPLAVNQGVLKAVRTGLFQNNPPVTRVVLDLTTPNGYQVFPSGNNIIVKLTAPSVPAAGLVPEGGSPEAVPAPSEPRVQVNVNQDLLTIIANRATLSEVLYEVHRLTGADIAIPSGAEQEQVVGQLGPGPGKAVLASLLNGTHFNFIILGAEGDPGGIHQLILSPKVEGMGAMVMATPPPAESVQVAAPPPEPEPEMIQPEEPVSRGAPGQAGQTPDQPAPAQENTPPD
jgi:hypothetical protein